MIFMLNIVSTSHKIREIMIIDKAKARRIYNIYGFPTLPRGNVGKYWLYKYF